MKTIKYIAAAVLCLLSLTTNAQTTMQVELEGGKLVEYPVSSVKSIKWVATAPDKSPLGAEAVDLGLSVKWANMNVGATAPEAYGDYFAWGETAAKSNYSWDTYNLCNGSENTMTKYCLFSTFGTVDDKTALEFSDDAARVNWGDLWRMPTKEELDELRKMCTWMWTSQNGVSGYKVVGPNGNFIFLPVAGYRYESILDEEGSDAYYWSSSLSAGGSDSAYILFFGSANVRILNNERFLGISVRAVCP